MLRSTVYQKNIFSPLDVFLGFLRFLFKGFWYPPQNISINLPRTHGKLPWAVNEILWYRQKDILLLYYKVFLLILYPFPLVSYLLVCNPFKDMRCIIISNCFYLLFCAWLLIRIHLLSYFCSWEIINFSKKEVKFVLIFC